VKRVALVKGHEDFIQYFDNETLLRNSLRTFGVLADSEKVKAGSSNCRAENGYGLICKFFIRRQSDLQCVP